MYRFNFNKIFEEVKHDALEILIAEGTVKSKENIMGQDGINLDLNYPGVEVNIEKAKKALSELQETERKGFHNLYRQKVIVFFKAVIILYRGFKEHHDEEEQKAREIYEQQQSGEAQEKLKF